MLKRINNAVSILIQVICEMAAAARNCVSILIQVIWIAQYFYPHVFNSSILRRVLEVIWPAVGETATLERDFTRKNNGCACSQQ